MTTIHNIEVQKAMCLAAIRLVVLKFIDQDLKYTATRSR
ncbi:type I toxin-antitoxin system ptaRNA1 family toxin [Vibrio cholerae]|nr:hypothetical protein [Vibrio cholerae]MBL4305108.1 type I toxin-antitoxin system ptaRNA1 family toxin [Vibrio fluvialis]EGQ8323378.1 hypothetical protein [Vibrio cholerae]EGR0610633.1 hypothetical protein [Vibrio cholerae]EGR0728311.1 hypothetical protein [Vibrio cholerae]